jgi:hypothetical protein
MFGNHRDDPAESAQRRQKILALMSEACRLAVLEGIPDLCRPGVVKQMIVSDALGHESCGAWHYGPGDAFDPKDPEKRFEYFITSDGKRFQAGIVRRSDWEAKKSFYVRFEKAAAIFFAVFDTHEPLKLLRVYRVETEAFRAALEQQIAQSKSAIVNSTFAERWVATNGTLVFPAGRAAHREVFHDS